MLRKQSRNAISYKSDVNVIAVQILYLGAQSVNTQGGIFSALSCSCTLIFPFGAPIAIEVDVEPRIGAAAEIAERL